MKPQLQLISASLKAARERKGLSQRALGEKVGLPQSHISKIEAGAVDLQTSSLIEIARALDLEVTLVSRAALPSVQALQTSPVSQPRAPAIDEQISRIVSQSELLKRRMPRKGTFDDLEKTVHDLRSLPAGPSDSQLHHSLESINDVLARLRKQHRTKGIPQKGLPLALLAQYVADLKRLRNEILHGGRSSSAAPRPAYRLDDEEERDGD